MTVKQPSRVAEETERGSSGRVTPHLPKPDGFRDTVESIVIAFIFAFVFRAFIVEAFIIPTGSMAPTLYGLHGQHRCACCKYPFAYGIREGFRLPDGRVQRGTLGAPITVRCPNCGWAGEGNNHLNPRHDRVVADAGDRILVLKWPYDIGGPWLGPRRWDVVVFKDPQNGEQNFIKRLLGLPGEVIEIVNGDLYTAPVTALSPELVHRLSEPRASGRGNAHPLPPALREELDGKLRIQRKPRVAQDSLWLIHYDHDYPPAPEYVRRGNPAFDPPMWKPSPPDANADSPWNTAAPRILFAPPADDTAEHAIHLAGKPIQDHYGYNLPGTNGNGRNVHVGDVRLSFVLAPKAARGYLLLLIQRGEDVFQVKIEASGAVTLSRAVPDRIHRPNPPVRTLASGKIEPLVPGRPRTIEFENLDYRVALRIDDELIVATTADQYRPDLRRLRGMRDGQSSRTEIDIAARDLALELNHLKIERDVFYRSSGVSLEDRNINGVQNVHFGGQPGWATASHPLLLRATPGDYFCCGDNSPQSKDSRLWWEVAPMLRSRGSYDRGDPASYQPGTVPADQMIGRAFFVYWPSGYRLFSTPFGFIPNVGRMRIIR